MNWYKKANKNPIIIPEASVRWMDRKWDLSTYDKKTGKPTKVTEKRVVHKRVSIKYIPGQQTISIEGADGVNITKRISTTGLQISLPESIEWMSPLAAFDRYTASQKPAIEEETKPIQLDLGLEIEPKRVKPHQQW